LRRFHGAGVTATASRVSAGSLRAPLPRDNQGEN